MFNNHFGLETAVLNGSKTMTRRVATTEKPESENFAMYHNIKDRSTCFGYFNDNDNHVFIDRHFHKLASSRYRLGETVAVRQSYETIYRWMRSLDPSPLTAEDFRVRHQDSKGWTNKMYTLTSEMPFGIEITYITAERLQDITEADITPTYQSFGDSADSLKDGKILAAEYDCGLDHGAYGVVAGKIFNNLVSVGFHGYNIPAFRGLARGVATNQGFVDFTTSILDTAMQNHITTKDEVLAMDLNGSSVADAITDQIAKIGEKIELAHFETIEAEKVYAYVHPGNRMASIVGLNKAGYDQVGHDIAMQVVAMRPVALDADSVPQEIKDQELRVAVEKTKEELVGKAVDAALKKAGINPAHVDSEEHMASNMSKGWITEEQVNQARQIKEQVAAEKAAQLSEQQINQIANGRLNKYFQENTLMEQEYIMEAKVKVKDFIAKADKDLKCTGFKRLELGA